MSQVFFPFLLAVVLTVPLHAEGGVWGARGSGKRFVVHGSDRLIAADGRGVAVYDISDPSALRQLDAEQSEDETVDVAIMGTSDVITATRRGVDRFSITPDGSLARMGSLELGSPVTRVAANARFAAAVMGNRVSILERTGDSFSVVRTLTKNDAILAVAFVGDYLYVSVHREATYVHDAITGVHVALVSGGEDYARAGSVLWVASTQRGLLGIDVREPGAPKNLPFIDDSPLGLTAVAAAGSRVYALEPPRRVHLFDATLAESPRLESTLEEWVEVIAAAGTHLFLSGAMLDGEGLRYESGLPLRVFDAADLDRPVLSDEVDDLAGPVSGVWTDGSIAYVVDPPFLRLLDVSTTASPKEISSLRLPSDAQERVRVKGGNAIVYSRGLVHLVDVSRPLQPVYVGTWDARGHPPSDAAILAGATFVEANMHSGLHVVDFTNPAAAHQVGGRIWHYHGIAAGDDAIYVLQASHFLALEVANGTTVVDRWQLIHQADQIEISPPDASQARYAVTRGSQGIHVFSLEDRFNPREIAHRPEIVSDLIGTGDGVAWLAIDGTLHRFDLGDEGEIVDSGYRVTSPMQISVAGEKIVVADRYAVRVYGPDTEAPPKPRLSRRRSVGR